jgi:hypothetical protein
MEAMEIFTWLLFSMYCRRGIVALDHSTRPAESELKSKMSQV